MPESNRDQEEGSESLYKTDIERHLFAFGDRPERLSDLPRESVAEKVVDLFERLPGLYREVVELRARHGLLYSEIAERLGVPVGTVKSRLHRARERLHELMEELELPRRGEAEDGGGEDSGRGLPARS